MNYQKRFYRRMITDDAGFQVVVEETDLQVHGSPDLKAAVLQAVKKQRSDLKTYINQYPLFKSTLQPWELNTSSPIIQAMSIASRVAGVGPMAAVAGAVAEHVGKALFPHEIILENGGDLFVNRKKKITTAIFAGKSPLSMKIGLHTDMQGPYCIATSSGTVGHSRSFGKSDAVCVISHSGALADAVAGDVAGEYLANSLP